MIDRRATGVSAAGVALFVIAAAALLVLIFTYVTAFHGSWDDSLNYLAAGERLNAGHDLYRVGPGDRAVNPEQQAGYSVPLVSPPLVGVVWRPLAALGDPVGVAIWWLAMAIAVVAAVFILFRWSPGVAGLALAAGAFPLLFQVTGGNMNAALLLATVAAWWAFATGRLALAGLILGVCLVAKGIPAPLCLWVVVCGGRSAIRGLGAGVAIAGAVSVLGAGLAAHLDYARFALDAATQETAYSLSGLATTYAGVPANVANVLPLVGLLAGSVALVLLRHRPSWAFALAVETMVFGFSGVHFHSYALLIGLAAPAAWAMRRDVQGEVLDAREVATLEAGTAP